MEKANTHSETANNLRQIGLVMHNYHAEMGTLPTAAICDKEGRPLLSWRVAILPLIEQANLYRQFKLDEPWNSPSNIKLLDQMPATYAMPGREAKKGETFFRVFTGAETIFLPNKPGDGPIGRGIRLTDITDGTSNTLMIVEAAESVPWTKPDDLPYDAKKPLPKLGGSEPDRFWALFADGSVRSLRTKMREETLRALITRAGAELPDWDEIEPGRNEPRRPSRPPQERESATQPKIRPEPERKP